MAWREFNETQECKRMVDELVEKLSDLNYDVEELKKKPHIFLINSVRVNIRSTRTVRPKHGNCRCFWYDISFNVLPQVKWVIYVTTEPYYFVQLPPDLLQELRPLMDISNYNENVGVFDIDWDCLTLDLKERKYVGISNYYCNLYEEDEHPQF